MPAERVARMRLTQIIERLQLGIKRRTVYDFDHRFSEASRLATGL